MIAVVVVVAVTNYGYTDIPGNLWDIRKSFWEPSHRLCILFLKGFRQSVMQAVRRLWWLYLCNFFVISWVMHLFTNDKVLHPSSEIRMYSWHQQLIGVLRWLWACERCSARHWQKIWLGRGSRRTMDKGEREKEFLERITDTVICYK